MKKLIITIISVIVGSLMIESCDKEKKEINCPIVYGTLVDARDGNRYPIVSICAQTWLAENLRFEMEGAYKNEEHPSVEYGLLYTHQQANKACPVGWHLPTDEEWMVLETVLGMTKETANKVDWRGEEEARFLKATSDWQNSGENSNSAGFRALPAGNHDTEAYVNLGTTANFWSASDVNAKEAWGRSLENNRKNIKRYAALKNNANSCRCIEDD